MRRTTYIVIQITSFSPNKPDVSITDIVPSSSTLLTVPSSVLTSHSYSTGTVTLSRSSNTSYQVRMCWDNGVDCRPAIVGSEDTKYKASVMMAEAVRTFLIQEELRVPLSADFDANGIVTMVYGVLRPNGENVWWEVVEGQVGGE